jgi:transcriptional regulator with XRE-family HTH domain
MKYGDRLKLAREHEGLSQEELAKVSGVGQGTISKIERGDQNSSGYDAVLSHTLSIDAMWLYSGKDEFAPEWLIPGKKNLRHPPEIFLKLSEENLLMLEQLANKILQSQENPQNKPNNPLTPTVQDVGGGG